MLTANVEQIRAMVASAQALGVPPGCAMFRQALRSVALVSEEKIATEVDHLKKATRWSDADAGIAVSRWPIVLSLSKETLQRKSDFFIAEVGLEPAYIARRPAMLSFSLEGRLRPRYYVMRFLKENGLLDHDRDYYGMILCSEKVFAEKFICPHKEAAPHLPEDYAAARRGEMPTNFRFI
ncbi:hypothetical protein ACQJBY_066409 [Aegilops geniculata]